MSDAPRNPPLKMTADTLFAKLLLTQEQREAIGCVAVESSRVDNLIEGMIWDLLDLDKPRGLAVTAKIQFKGKAEMLYELIKLRDPKAGTAFAGLYSDLTNINAKRRLIIHGTWDLPGGRGTGNYLAMLVSGQYKQEHEAHATFPKGNVKPFPASEVMAVAQELGALYFRLIDFLIEHSEALLDRSESLRQTETDTPHPSQ